jgi:hypothetical protein
MPISPTLSRLVLLLALVDASACASDRAPASKTDPARSASVSIATPTRVATPVRTVSVQGPLVTQQGDTGSPRRATPKLPALTEAEQRVADAVVFAPKVTQRFLVASRNKRLLVDVGRIDLEGKLDAGLLSTVRRVSARVGPLANVTHMRVRGSWGDETDSIVGYDVWNGRAVAVLAANPRTDSLLRKNAPLVGVATRDRADSADTAASTVSVPAPVVKPAVAPSASAAVPVCVRDSIAPILGTRVSAVRDSLVRWVTDSLRSPFARFAKTTTVRGDATVGCFGPWRAVVVVTSRTPTFEWNEERALLVAPDGKVQTARLRDLRLRAHESLIAFDADGDGVDELSARGFATRMGAQSVLKLDPATRRFARFASGFAWETR